MNYKEHHKYFWANVLSGYYSDSPEIDPDVAPIKVPLPEPPPLELIDGYGLPPEQQVFTRPEYPVKLRQLENRLKKEKKNTLENIWEELNSRPKEYENEIRWIGQQQWYRYNGYWCFINGTPTYISRWHYVFLTAWNMDVGLPEYRDSDRRWFLFAEFCYTDTKTVDGIDTGQRICAGFADPKARRFGDTTKAACVMFCIVTEAPERNGGIQGKDGDNAKMVFRDHIVKPFTKLPFYYKPANSGSSAPAQELLLSAASAKIGSKGSYFGTDTGLNSKINHATTADRSFYDGYILHAYIGDEAGKTVSEDVNLRNAVILQCLKNGADIHGFAIYPTTVEEMVGKGGQYFFNLCQSSQYDKPLNDKSKRKYRDASGKTPSMLYIYFRPAYDGLQGFIGKYGESIIETPTYEQSLFIKKKIGAKEYLQSQIDIYSTNKDYVSLSNQKRMFPMKYSHCFIGQSVNLGFPTEIIETRISEKRMEGKELLRGNFVRIQGTTKVDFIPDQANGRFIVSHIPDPLYTCKMIRHGAHYAPVNSKFTASADMFRFDKTDGNRASLGGGAVIQNRDLKKDPPEKSVQEWETFRIVCTYAFKPPTKEDFCEDMLNMCIFYGAMMYPENNVPGIQDYFIRKGFAGYLEFDINPITFTLKNNAGMSTLGDSKQEIFQSIQTYLYLRGAKEEHIEFLEDCLSIKSIDDMKDFDRFTAVGVALVSVIKKMEVRNDSETDNTNGVDLRECGFTKIRYR